MFSYKNMSFCSKAAKIVPLKTKEYFDHGSIHGLRYITEPNRHFTERVFWICMVLAAMFGTYSLLGGSWYNFHNNAVSFVVETSYLDWDTNFPAVSVCESDSLDKIDNLARKLFGRDHNMNMNFYLGDIVFFDGTCYSCKTHCGNSINCSEDMKYLVNEGRSSCNQLLNYCTWNGKPFDCCSQFLPLQTETGPCYTINSLHTKSNVSKIKLISNKKTGPGQLDFQVHEAAKLFIHSTDDVPYINHPEDEQAVLNWGTVFSMTFQVNEIENDPALTGVPVEQRNCRFPQENTLAVYNYYSYSACVVDCRTKAQIEFCNCTHHFIPEIEGVNMCSIDGLACLTNYSGTLRPLRTKDNEQKGLVCSCMSSCIEPEYTVIRKAEKPIEDYSQSQPGSKVSVIMDTLPSQRFKRNVVRTYLDLVVSMGGTAGLFLGASLLSIVELLVYIFLRGNTKGKENSLVALDNKHTRTKKKKNIITTVLHQQSNISYQRGHIQEEYLKYRESYASPYLS